MGYQILVLYLLYLLYSGNNKMTKISTHYHKLQNLFSFSKKILKFSYSNAKFKQFFRGNTPEPLFWWRGGRRGGSSFYFFENVLKPTYDRNPVPTFSPSSSHTWQTYLSHRPLFHPNSNWHLSHLFWKNLVYRNRISQISDRYPIWIPSAKSLSVFALWRFFHQISKSPSFSPLKFAYRKFHSTETALLKLANDSGKITILTALDMSAAFDTLDHTTLLKHTFGLSSHVISWIRSYLTDRSSCVKIDLSSSPSTTILSDRRASELCSRSTTFCPFHITNCKCHKFWSVKPK